MNNIKVFDNRFLPERMLINENANFLLLYTEFFTKDYLNEFSKFLLKNDIMQISVDSFKIMKHLNYYDFCPKNLLVIDTDQLYNYFFLELCDSKCREFFLESAVLIDKKRKLSIIIDKSSEVIVISTSSEEIRDRFVILMKPYAELRIEEKINYLYNTVFFNKRIAEKFLKKLMKNYFYNEVKWIKK